MSDKENWNLAVCPHCNKHTLSYEQAQIYHCLDCKKRFKLKIIKTEFVEVIDLLSEPLNPLNHQSTQ